MKYIISIFIIMVLYISSGVVYSQNLHTSSNKALKAYNDGVSAFDFIDFNKAETDFKEAITIDSNFFEAYMMLGELFSKQSRYSEASLNYRKAVKIDSLYYRPVFFNLAYAEFM